MELINKFLNEGMAWIAVILGIVLSSKYIVRKSIKIYPKYKKLLSVVNKHMKKTHILMGVLLIVVGMIHGIFSSTGLSSINIGIVCWTVAILLGINWMLRKYFNKPSMWIKYHRILTILFLLTMIFHIVDVKKQDILEFKNEIFSILYRDNKKIKHDEESTTPIKINDNYNLNDGTYQGKANGLGPNLVLNVTVKDNKIKDTEITSHNERNESYYGWPIKEISKSIIESQTLDIDAISGATYTSNGIVDAVKDALDKAKK
ncbi:FMN-binding protein [Romboutsia lituseburensis]|uniref:FMN-binding protein n=1 Tax=Romboutsia lituseburensis TaxID=1537 RepID=UPI00215B566E|nr:FMN-binding protein [Romboutsia lituseburensis]MCR8745156.1 FMN-binding protein [Romboutsia lituseburensis]